METVLKNRVISRKLGYSDSYYRGDNLPELQPLIQPLIDAAAEFDLLAFCHRVHSQIWKPRKTETGFIVMEFASFENKAVALNVTMYEGRIMLNFDIDGVDHSDVYRRYLILTGVVSEVPEKVRQMLANEVRLSDLLPEIRTKFAKGVIMELWRSPNGVHLHVIRNGNPAENIIGGYVVRNNPDFEKVSEIKSYNEFLNLIK